MATAPIFRERPTAPIAPEGWPFLAPLAVATAAAVAWAPLWLAALVGGLTLFVAAFFRNPTRALPGDERTVVAPADGRVLCVDEIEHPTGGKGLRIGIFLSVFDVHVNRAPLAGRVVSIERSGSLYLAAWNPRGERENVQLALTLELADGRRIVVTQITGLIARRIVCHARVGEWIERGARYGLIRFGSRTDVLLPLGSRAAVQVGDRVRGGATILARLGEPG
ncbi:MAG TPA: phosphatidylserine decarboxylase [Myxococcota bacterium]|nr:phosphatidylserine decarboxylase [Myxococcota bacterium]